MAIPMFKRDIDPINVHSPQHPHWSESVEWRSGRWDSMSSAPTKGSTIMFIRGRGADGQIFEQMHYAVGGGDEQPPFEGWFVASSDDRSFCQVFPVEWQPSRALMEEREKG